MEETVNEKARSLRADTFRSPQKPPVAASRARATDSSSSRKEDLPKDTTMVKCPDPDVG
jgi:hypothetical protein